MVAATEVCSRFIGTCGELSPPSPPSLPLSLFAFWVFLNVILRISPFFLWCVPGRLFVAGNTFLSLLSLSLPLSFFPSLFLSSPSSLGVPGCFRHSWSPTFLCVLGRLCSSWDLGTPLLPSLLLLFSPPPPPLSSRVRIYKQTRLLQQVSQ